MHRSHIILFILLLSLALSGCAKRLHIEDAQEAGAPQLSGKQIKDLITGSTVRLVSWDKADEANVSFFANGSLEGENRWGETTTGRWKIDKKGQLCLKYRKWGSGFLTCYSVILMDDSYKLFRVDGGLDTSFTVLIPGKSAAQAMAEAPSLTPTRTVAPQEKKKSWVGSLWPWGKEEQTLTPAINDTDVFIAPAPAIKQALSADLLEMLDDRKCPGCDLSGKNLSGIKLKGAKLQGANLAGANLSQTNLENANLKGANLSGANLELADLEDANLEGADLAGARLVDTFLKDANLANANLEGANLHWADLRDANLGNANLIKAYLVKTNFTDADLTGADLTDAVIQRTIFEDTKGYTSSIEKRTEGVNTVLEPLKKNKKWWWPF
jgi:hypothetical protein